ncbi:hypothetical protein D7X33_26660 [Butyricicoccus sp. 1XD8-22]|nr:hypothetical protein D7X33_26660 [Butyricicoccus sp. 1XD8-22]
MDKMTSVLLAVGEDNLSKLFRKVLVESGHPFDVLDNEVLHRRFLFEMVAQYQPNLLIVHDKFLPGDKLAAEERDAEMLEILQYIRFQFDQQVRIVYVCIRDRTDPFLGKIVGLGIHDIFHSDSFRTDAFLEQLVSPPKFSNVQKFARGDFNFQQMKNAVGKQDESEYQSETLENDEALNELHEHSADDVEEKGFLGKVRGILKPFKVKNEHLIKKITKVETEEAKRTEPTKPNSKEKEIKVAKKELQEEFIDNTTSNGLVTVVEDVIESLDHVTEEEEEEEFQKFIDEVLINRHPQEETTTIPQPNFIDSEIKDYSASSLVENMVDANLENPEKKAETGNNTTTETSTETKSKYRTEQHKSKTRNQSQPEAISQQVPPKLQERELVTFGPVVLAVAALTSNSGVTSTAISIAKYLKSISKRVAIIELNQSLGFERLHAFYENSYDLLIEDDWFECEGIMHYKHRLNLQVHTIINQYDYVVLDMGLLSETNSYISEFKRAPIRLIITPDQNWKWFLVDRLSQQDPYALDDYTFLLPTSNEAIAKQFKKEFGVQNAEAFPMLKNMYDLTSEDIARIENLINRFFVMNKSARKSNGKKRWFF